MATTKLDKHVKEFLEHLEFNRRLSLKTVKSYEKRLRLFFEFFKFSAKDIKHKNIEEYSSYLARRHPASTQKNYITTVVVFAKYLLKKGIIKDYIWDVDLPKTPEKIPVFLTPEEVNEMLDGAKTTRNKAIVSLLFDSGLRASELTNLKIEDVNMKELKGIVKNGKGNKNRLIFFREGTRDLIFKYITDERKDKCPYLFVTSERKEIGQLKSQTVLQVIKTLADYVGIKKSVGVHTLRHSFATNMLSNGLDIRVVQELLGHKSITSTQVYTHITDHRLQQFHREYRR